MPECIVICEGPTERTFCRDVVSPWAATFGCVLRGTLLQSHHGRQGGVQDWHVFRKEILRLAYERPSRMVCVMIDFYAMPKSWPGRTGAMSQNPDNRGIFVEQALQQDLSHDCGASFRPCVMLHEFESLLFVDPATSAKHISASTLLRHVDTVTHELQQIKKQFRGKIEHINDSPNSAPSKRIQQIVEGYDKVAFGASVAADVGLKTLRANCPWLDRWLTQIEELGEA